LKFEHKKGPPPLVVGILLVVGCIITLVMHSNLKLPSTPRKKERKKEKKRKKSGVWSSSIVIYP
jgi:hypothetical protein